MSNTAARVERSTGDLIKAAASGWLGTAMEFMDFQLYSLASALVFNKLFFPEQSPAVALIASMATYGVGYIARPVGAWYFGRMGDRIGRKKVLYITIALMGAATTLIGLLPTYAQIGVFAPLFLVLLRLAQGFGAGAEIAGASVMLAEYAPVKQRGFVSSFVCLGTNSGTLAASGIWAILVTTMSNEALLSWGWRIPFVGSFLIMFFALWIRSSLKESPVFESREDVVDGVALSAQELKETKKETGIEAALHSKKGKAFFLAMGIRIGESGNSGLIQTYLMGFLVTFLALSDKSIGPTAIMIGSVLGFITVPLFGYLGDRFGRRTMYIILSAFQAIWAFPLLLLLNTKNPFYISIAIIVGLSVSVLGMFSVQSSYLCEIFGARNRYTQLALAKEFGGILAAGIAPIIAASFVAATGSWWPVAIMMVVYSMISLVSSILAPETRGRDLTLLEDAV